MNRLNVFLIMAILFMLGWEAPVQAQLPSPDGGSTELRISVDNSVVKAGGPLVLHIILKNMHKEKYCHHPIGEEGRAELNGYEVEAIDAAGNTLPILKQKRLRGWSLFGQCLDHGKSTDEEMDVNRLVDISRPGAYRLSVSHLDIMTNEKVWSNSISISIIP